MNNPTQASADQAEMDVMDLREYWNILRRNLRGILGFAFVISAIVISILFVMADVYKADTTVLIEADLTKVVPTINQVYDFGIGKSEYYATQFTLLNDRSLTNRVIAENQRAFEIYFDKEYPRTIKGLWENIVPGSETKKDKMVDYFTSNLTITPSKDTQLVTISYLSKNDALAVNLANDLASAYIDSSMEAQLNMTNRASTMLTEKIEGVKQKLVESEQRLQVYRDSEDLVDIQGVATLTAKELDDAAQKLADTRKAKADDENAVSQIDTLPVRTIQTLSSIPEVLKDTLVQKFKDEEGTAQQKLITLSKRYGDQHPTILAARSNLETAKKNTADQVLNVVEGIRKQYELDKATEAYLTKQVADLREKVQVLNRKQLQVDELSREVDLNRQLYDTFFSRIKEITEQGSIKTPIARIVDPAVPSSIVAKPKRVLLSVVTVIVSLMLGIFLAFFKESINRTVRSKDDILLKLHSPLLGVLPLLKNKAEAETACMQFAKQSAGAFSESVRTLRTGVVLSGVDNPHKILLVTSSIPDEGKTTVSVNLAAAFGNIGKTLLIDADMRRPAIAKNVGLQPSSPGLSNLVAETAEAKECIHRIDSLGIDVIPAGTVPPNPLELLSSKRFAAVLAGLEKNYDRIIIDSAPCEAVSDALILSTLASAVIYVVKADATHIKIVQSGLARLRAAKAPVMGVVLNQIDMEKHSLHGDGHYFGGYYDYYGYGSSSSSQSDG